MANWKRSSTETWAGLASPCTCECVDSISFSANFKLDKLLLQWSPRTCWWKCFRRAATNLWEIDEFLFLKTILDVLWEQCMCALTPSDCKKSAETWINSATSAWFWCWVHIGVGVLSLRFSPSYLPQITHKSESDVLVDFLFFVLCSTDWRWLSKLQK